MAIEYKAMVEAVKVPPKDQRSTEGMVYVLLVVPKAVLEHVERGQHVTLTVPEAHHGPLQ